MSDVVSSSHHLLKQGITEIIRINYAIQDDIVIIDKNESCPA